jgi:hypothetical protein
VPTKPPITTASPAPREKTLKEFLQEIANAGTVKAATEGFKEIDRYKEQARRKLAGLGLSGDIVDHALNKAAHELKRKAAELVTGRPQP